MSPVLSESASRFIRGVKGGEAFHINYHGDEYCVHTERDIPQCIQPSHEWRYFDGVLHCPVCGWSIKECI